MDVRIRDGEGVALSRAITAAESGKLEEASYYVRDASGVVRARVDRQGGITLVIRDGLGREVEDATLQASSTCRPDPSGDEPKEEHEVAERKTRAKTATAKRPPRSRAPKPAESAEPTEVEAPAEASLTVEATVEAAGDALYRALMEHVREVVGDVQEKPNTSGTYTRLLRNGKAFAYVFPPRKGGVALKIPKQLLAVEHELPAGHGFKATGWGLTRTVKDEQETPAVARSLAVAAKAVEA